eukprot:1157823-Pelagomonas_calceolata.AAC.12
MYCSMWFISIMLKLFISRKKEKKERLCLPGLARALRKGYLKGRAPPHRPRGRGGTGYRGKEGLQSKRLTVSLLIKKQ